MSNFLKNIFGKKEDDIPEMKLNKNDPRPYYNKEYKCWMIPGQEEEKKKELEAAKKGPPKKSTQASSSDNQGVTTGATAIKTSVASSSSSTQKRKPGVANRYASAFPSENISEKTENLEHSEKNINEKEKMIYKPNNSIPKNEPRFEENQSIDNINNTLFYSVQENLNNNPDSSRQERDIIDSIQNDQAKRGNMSSLPIASQNIKEIENKIRLQLEEENAKQFLLMKNEFEFQINELKEVLQLSEETSYEKEKILRTQLNNFIRENLELKLENERNIDELGFKQNEIVQYQGLIENYRKVIDEEITEKKAFNYGEFPESNADFAFIYTKIEKLENEKLIMINELIETRREVTCLTLDKSILEYKLKEIENCYNANSTNLKESYLEMEKNFLNSEIQIKILIKNIESLERESKRIEELTKQNEDLVARLNENNYELQKIKKLNEMSTQEAKNFYQINSQFKTEVIKLKNSLEEKDNINYRALKDIREKMNEYRTELESRDKFKDELKKYEEILNENNSKIFNYEKMIRDFETNMEKLKNFIAEVMANDSDNDNDLLKNISNLNIENFEIELSLLIKSILNNKMNLNNQNKINDLNNTLLIDRIKNLTIEIEILKNSRNENFKRLSQSKQEVLELQEEMSKIKDEKIKLANDRTNKEEIELKNNEIIQLNESLSVLKLNVKTETIEKEKYLSQVGYLQNQIVLLNEQTGRLNELNFSINLNDEKIVQDLKDRDDIINYIINEIDATVDTENEANIVNEENNFNSEFIEASLANKVKLLKNLVEKYKFNETIISNELRIYKEDVTRKENTIMILDDHIKTLKSTMLVHQDDIKNLNNGLNNMDSIKKEISEKDNFIVIQNNEIDELKNLLREKKETIENMSNTEKEITNKDNLIFELSNEIENLRTLLSNKEANSEKTSILGLEIETYKDKALKLKELLDNTIAHYEKGIESIKNKQKQKLSEMKIQNENLSKEYENLKQIMARYEEKIDEINNEKEIMREMNKSLDNEKNDNLESIKSLCLTIDNLNNELNNKNIKISQTEQLVTEIKNYSEENTSLTKRNHQLQKEQELLIEKLNDKNNEISEQKNSLSDIESQLEKSKSSYEEINRNYELLIRNHKSAEKLNELNRKIQHMIEEKNMLNQSHGLIVENLTNEIKSLTENLNEYKKKDLTLNLNLHKEDQVKEENRIKVTNNKTEVVSVTPTASGTALTPDTAKELSKPKSDDDHQRDTLKKDANQVYENKRQFGFFSKFIAPIFLTEKEIETMKGGSNN